jgi:hypothetical protein
VGFPAYGGGPFERIGLRTSVPLLAVYVLVCLAEVAVGVMLLMKTPHAAAISHALLPVESLSGSASRFLSGRRSPSPGRSCSYSPDTR